MAIRTIPAVPDVEFAALPGRSDLVVVVTERLMSWAVTLLPLVSEKYIATRAMEIKNRTAMTQGSDHLFDVMTACEALSKGHSYVPEVALVDEVMWGSIARFALMERQIAPEQQG